MKKYLLVLSLLFSIPAAHAQDKHSDYEDPQNMRVEPEHTDCHKLPSSFESVEQAVEILEASRFNLDQNFKTTRRSGLMRARFMSCDFKTGFLIVHYDGEDQVYPNIETELWDQFKSTADIDGFYFKQIEQLPTIKIP